jgi:hypothetical protein
MGFAAYLKEEYLDFDLEDEQRSEVFMNSLIVTTIQFICILFVWTYALEPKFQIIKASSFKLIVARFIASMLMHI